MLKSSNMSIREHCMIERDEKFLALAYVLRSFS